MQQQQQYDIKLKSSQVFFSVLFCSFLFFYFSYFCFFLQSIFHISFKHTQPLGERNFAGRKVREQVLCQLSEQERTEENFVGKTFGV